MSLWKRTSINWRFKTRCWVEIYWKINIKPPVMIRPRLIGLSSINSGHACVDIG